MKIKLLILFTLLSSFTVNAQKAEMLAGKWIYEDIADKEKLDSASLKMVKMFFSEMALYFKSNGHYKAFIMGKQDEGNWKLNKEENLITLNSNQGRVSDLNLISLGDKNMTINIGKGTFIMKRTKPDAKDEVETVITKPVTKSATSEEVSRKWHLKNKEVPGRKQEDIFVPKDSYFDLRKDGTYETLTMGFKESGTWKFGENNGSIITSAEGHSKIWNIYNVTATELILIKGNSEEKWIYSIVE